VTDNRINFQNNSPASIPPRQSRESYRVISKLPKNQPPRRRISTNRLSLVTWISKLPRTPSWATNCRNAAAGKRSVWPLVARTTTSRACPAYSLRYSSASIARFSMNVFSCITSTLSVEAAYTSIGQLNSKLLFYKIIITFKCTIYFTYIRSA